MLLHQSPMSSHVPPITMPLAMSLTSTQPLHSKVANLSFKSPNLYVATVNGQQCIVSHDQSTNQASNQRTTSDSSFHPMVVPLMQQQFGDQFNSSSSQSQSSATSLSNQSQSIINTTINPSISSTTNQLAYRQVNIQHAYRAPNHTISDNGNGRRKITQSTSQSSSQSKKGPRPRSASLVSNKSQKPKSLQLQSSIRSPPPVSTTAYSHPSLQSSEDSAMEALTSAASVLLAAAAAAAAPLDQTDSSNNHAIKQSTPIAASSHAFRVPHSVSKPYHSHSHGSPPSYHSHGSLSHVLPTPVSPRLIANQIHTQSVNPTSSHYHATISTTSPHAHPAHALFMPSRVPLSPSGSPRFNQLTNQRKSNINVPQLLLSQSTPVSPHSSHPLSHLSSIPALSVTQETITITKDSLNQRRASLSTMAAHSASESLRQSSDDSSLLSLLSACNASSRNVISNPFLSDGDSSDETSSSEISSSGEELASEMESSSDSDNEQFRRLDNHNHHDHHSVVPSTAHVEKRSLKSEKPSLPRKRAPQRRAPKSAQSPNKSAQSSAGADTSSLPATGQPPARKRTPKQNKSTNTLKVEIPPVKKRSRRQAIAANIDTPSAVESSQILLKEEVVQTFSDVKPTVDQPSSESSPPASDSKTVDSILNELMTCEGAGKRGRVTRNSLLSVLDSMLDSSPKKQRTSRRKSGTKDESHSENTSAPSTPYVAPHMSPSMPSLMLSPLAPSSTSSIGTSASQSLHLSTPALQLESPAAAQTTIVSRSLESSSIALAERSTSPSSLLFTASLSCSPNATVQVKIEPTSLVTIEENQSVQSVEPSRAQDGSQSTVSTSTDVQLSSPSAVVQQTESLMVDSPRVSPSRKRSRPNSRRSSISAPQSPLPLEQSQHSTPQEHVHAVQVDSSADVAVMSASVVANEPSVESTQGATQLDLAAESITTHSEGHELTNEGTTNVTESDLPVSTDLVDAVPEDVVANEAAHDQEEFFDESRDEVTAEDEAMSASEETESERQARLKREERATAAFLKSLLKEQPARTRSEAKMSKVKRRIREHTLVELASKQRSSKRRRTSDESAQDIASEAADSGDEQQALEEVDVTNDTAPTAHSNEELLVEASATSSPLPTDLLVETFPVPDASEPVDATNPATGQPAGRQSAHSTTSTDSQGAGKRTANSKNDRSIRDEADTESDEEAEQRPRSDPPRRSSRMSDDEDESDLESESSEDIDLSSTDLDEFSPSSSSSSSSEEVTESSSSEEEEQPKKRRRSELDKLHEGFAAIVHMEKKKSRRAERERIRQERKAADAALRDQLRQIRAEERYIKLKEKRVRLRAEIRARGEVSETPAERVAKMERRRAREAVLKARQTARTERRRVREEARKKRRDQLEAEEEAEEDADEDEAKALAEARKARAAAFKLAKQKRRDLRRQRKKALLEELLKNRKDSPVKPPRPSRSIEKPVRDAEKPIVPDREPAKPKRKPPKPIIPSRPTARQAIMSLIAEARDESSSSSTESPSSPEPPSRQTSKSSNSSSNKAKSASASAERGASRAVVRKPPPAASNVKGMSAVERRRLEQEKARASDRPKATSSSVAQPAPKATQVRTRPAVPTRPSPAEIKQPVKPVESKNVVKSKPPVRDSVRDSAVRSVAKKEQKPSIKEEQKPVAKETTVKPVVKEKDPPVKPPVVVSTPPVRPPVRRNKRIHDSEDDEPDDVVDKKSTESSLKKIKVDAPSHVSTSASPETRAVLTHEPSPSPPPVAELPPAVISQPIADVAPVAPPRQAKTMNSSYWTDEELSSLRSGVEQFGHNFDAIKRHFTALFKRRTPPNLREKAISLALGTANK